MIPTGATVCPRRVVGRHHRSMPFDVKRMTYGGLKTMDALSLSA